MSEYDKLTTPVEQNTNGTLDKLEKIFSAPTKLDNLKSLSVLSEESADSLRREVQKRNQERKAELVANVSSEGILEELETYEGLSPKDRVQYMYQVRPHLKEVSGMLEQNITAHDIADTLNIPRRAFQRMIKEIPEMSEIFILSQEAMMQKVEASLMSLTQYNVIEEEALTKQGDVVALKKVIPPNLNAIKHVLGHNPLTSDKYSKTTTIVHKQELDQDIKDILSALSPEVMKNIEKDAERILEAEFTESDHGE